MHARDPYKTASYEYVLPPELIAQTPADRRDASRLVGETGISLSSLVDWMTRRGPDDWYMTRSAGPFRLVELPRTRGTRNG